MEWSIPFWVWLAPHAPSRHVDRESMNEAAELVALAWNRRLIRWEATVSDRTIADPIDGRSVVAVKCLAIVGDKGRARR